MHIEKFVSVNSEIEQNSDKYKFGEGKEVFMTSIQRKMSVLENRLIIENVDNVLADVPFLFELSSLHQFSLYVNNVKKVL